MRKDFSEPPNYWEPLIVYAYLAAQTTKLRLGTGILVLPMRRDIVVVARQLATLDHLSKGRLMVGLEKALKLREAGVTICAALISRHAAFQNCKSKCRC